MNVETICRTVFRGRHIHQFCSPSGISHLYPQYRQFVSSCNWIFFCNTELDLDFLERRQNAGSTSNNGGEGASQQSPIEVSPESVDRVKVILLGAPAVGKTSIIQVKK